MCDEESRDIGELVPNETIIYRACTRRSDLAQSENRVREIAFQKMGRLERNKDGLSFRTAPEGCNDVDHFGILRIRVGDIHELGRHLEVRFDANDPTHVLLRNLPCMDREPEEKVEAEATAAELSFLAVPHSFEPNKRPPK
jgi:hypothetical protein